MTQPSHKAMAGKATQIPNPNGRIYGIVIDTSGEEALIMVVKREEVAGERRWVSGPGEGRMVLEKIEELLKEVKIGWGKIERVGVKVTGQRMFSSLRAGVTVANFLGYAKEVKIIELAGGDEAEMRGDLWVGEAARSARVRYGAKGSGAEHKKINR